MNSLSFFHQPQSQALTQTQLQDFLIQQGFFHDELNLPSDHSFEMGQLTAVAKEYVLRRHDHEFKDSIEDLEQMSQVILRKPYQNLEERQQVVIQEFAKLLAQDCEKQ